MKKYLLLTVALFIIIAGCLLYYFVFRNTVSYNQDVYCNVSDQVSIKRDEFGLPEVTVESIDDLYFTFGFIHAQDCYSLMEYYRLIAKAEADDRFGSDSTVLNRLSLACGFYEHAQKLEKSLDDTHKKFLQRYVDGINQANHESVVLGRNEWSPADVLAVLLLKEWSNSFLNNKELVFAVNNEHKNFKMNYLFPGSLLYYYDEEEHSGLVKIKTIQKILEKYIGTFNRGSIYYIPGKNTKYNSNALAFSFEDSGILYPGWCPVVYNIKGKKNKVITHVGLPFLFGGSSDNFSFVSFNLNIDIQDFYYLEIRENEDIIQYKSSFGWKDLIDKKGIDSAQDVITKKDSLFNIIKTDYGICVNKIINQDEIRDSIVTINYDFPQQDYIVSLFDVPFADDIKQARKLVQHITSYPRIYFFTDDKYAYQCYSGKIPKRSKQQNLFNQYYTQPWNSSLDISFYSFPVLRKKVSGSSFFYFIPGAIALHATHDEYRYRHIDKKLSDTKIFSENSLQRFLQDTYSPIAELFVPYFLSILKNNLVTSSNLSQIYFHNWDFTMKANSVQASLFSMILKQFIIETYSDEFPNDIDTIVENYYYLLPQFYELVRRNISPVFDDKYTEEFENRDTIFDRSFLISMRHLNRKAGPVMEQWKWGDIHAGNYKVFSVNNSMLDTILFSEKPAKFNGGNDTLFKGPVCRDNTIKSVTTLCGFFTSNRSNIFLNYAMSTNQLSDFSNRKIKKVNFKRFEKVKSKYLMHLKPTLSQTQ